MVRFFLFVFSMMVWTPGYGFTLVSQNPPLYLVNEIIVDFTADLCSTTGHGPEELFLMAEEAVNNYWNKVTTAKIILKKSVVTSVNSDGYSLTNMAMVADDNHILVGCNNDISSFAAGGVAAVGGLASFSGITKGAVLINDHARTPLPYLSRSEIIALMAHELGHALGLGHSSDETAVMYYSLGGKIQEKMAQDDFDGLTYLYPQDKQLAGLAGSCGTVNLIREQNSRGQGHGHGHGDGNPLGAEVLQVLLGALMGLMLLNAVRRVAGGKTLRLR